MDENFKKFVDLVSKIALEQEVSSVEDLLICRLNDKSIKEIANELSAKVGEKIDLRRLGDADEWYRFGLNPPS